MKARLAKNIVLPLALSLLMISVGCSRELRVSVEPVTFVSMLSSLTNRVAIAMPPREGVMRMVSSYDRTGGNNDWLQDLVPDADGLVTLADLKGPGCVVRIWMTGYRYHDLRFYIDGETEPRISLPPLEFFGKSPPFSYPLAGIVSSGSYSYVPIPYNKSLVIKGHWPDIRPDNRPYLHVNYYTYPRGTQVESFPETLSDEQLAAAEAVVRRWQKPDLDVEHKLFAGLETADQVVVEPGGTHVWLDETGEGMIEGFAISLGFDEETSALRRQHALREIALHVYWDGEDAPSVAVPLGDYFGNALAWRQWRSMFAGQTNGVFVSQWPMPYSTGARGALRNDGPFPIAIKTSHITAIRPEGSRYFHAAWHHAVGDGRPYPILHTEGSGHYVGCYMTSLAFEPSWNILEGDESFQVDDDPWPSIHGTGLEDYFNGAWYYTGIFDLPIHGLLEKAAMRTQQYRWHPSDPVAFSKRLSMQIEFGHGNAARGYMASVAYWYQDRPQPQRPLAPNPRRKPPDPLEGAVIMAELFELERVGLLEEAAERCEIYAQRIGNPDVKALLAMRKAGYEFLQEGKPWKAGLFDEMAKQGSDAVRAQAAILDRLYEKSDRGLLGVQCRASYHVFLNGKMVGEGMSPERMDVWPITIDDDHNEIAVAVTPQTGAAFLSVGLRRGNAFLWTDGDWEVTHQMPKSWPLTGESDEGWLPAEIMGGEGMLPRMDCWVIPLNAFPLMQSERQLYRASDGWDTPPGRTFYFRRRFTKIDMLCRNSSTAYNDKDAIR